jgi:hypothetical protein
MTGSNHDDAKKKRELRQLRLVYSAQDFPEVIDRDKPDFAIKDGDHWFGVEATSYFQNHSSARVHSEKSHFGYLLDTGTVPKRETDDIRIVNLVFGPADAPMLGPKMIWQRRPSAAERVNALIEIIEDKREKAKEYDSEGKLKYFDLVIADEEGELRAGSEGELRAGSEGPQILKKLREFQEQPQPVAPFRRITLVIRHNSWETYTFTFQ